jgi:hypothetical protein
MTKHEHQAKPHDVYVNSDLIIRSAECSICGCMMPDDAPDDVGACVNAPLCELPSGHRGQCISKQP